MGTSIGLGFEVVLAISSYSGPGKLQKPGHLPQTAFSKKATAPSFSMLSTRNSGVGSKF